MGNITIRAASRDDLPAIRDLLTERDERPWTDEQTAWFLLDLDPRHCLGFVAWDGARPVGLTTLFVREVEVDGEPRSAGYWANLYVHPDYRVHMLYPRLPMTMLAAFRALPNPLVYSLNRLPALSRAHQALGFALVGRVPVLARPLRPARFLARYLGGGEGVASLVRPLDRAFEGYRSVTAPRARGEISVRQEAPSAALAGELAHALATWEPARFRQRWSGESLRMRYATTREGTSYHAVVARTGTELSAFAVYRVAERGKGIGVGVIMELAARDFAALPLRLALAEAETQATRLGADLMILLDGLGPEAGRALRALGYRGSREVYDALVWPKDEGRAGASLADLGGWRFSFADHDAF